MTKRKSPGVFLMFSLQTAQTQGGLLHLSNQGAPTFQLCPYVPCCKRNLKNNKAAVLSPSRWTTVTTTWFGAPSLRTRSLSFCSSVLILPKDSPLCLVPICPPHLTCRTSAKPSVDLLYQGDMIWSSFAIPGRKTLPWFSFPHKHWRHLFSSVVQDPKVRS